MQIKARHRKFIALFDGLISFAGVSFTILIGILTFLLLCQTISALDIPFYAAIYSDNHLNYYPDRELKTLSWDEKYLLTFGVDSLRWKNIGLDLQLISQPDFREQQVLIDRFEASWNTDNLSVTCTTRPQGIGKNYYFQQQYVSAASFNEYEYEQNRFNGLELKYNPSELLFFGGLGGNVHNQAMGHLGFSRAEKGSTFSVVIDGSARDTHWNSPQLTFAFYCEYEAVPFTLRSDTAYKHIFSWEERNTHEEFFQIAELSCKTGNLPELKFGVDYYQKEYAPKRTLGLDAALYYQTGLFSFSPGVHFTKTDGSFNRKLDFISKWHLSSQNTIGIYAAYDHTLAHQDLFQVGLQSNLRLDF